VLRLEKTFQDNKAKHKIFPTNIAGWDWQNAALDSGKIMIAGGSYGGYMTWAIAYEYNDKNCQRWDPLGYNDTSTTIL